MAKCRAIIAPATSSYFEEYAQAVTSADSQPSPRYPELADRLIAVGTTLLGVILAVTPVALWVAWSATVFSLVVAVAIASAGLLVLLANLPHQAERPTPAHDGKVVLPDEFIAEVHRLFPLTYHHSLLETARFRRAMEKLSRMIMPS